MQHDFILLDRSGSMQKLWTEAISSVNAYVKQIAIDKVDTGVTVAVFDHHMGKTDFTVIRDRIIPSTFRPISTTEVEPRGWTPLNDAVGQIVGLANVGGYDKVAMIFMTDGEENKSTELKAEDVKKLLDACRAKNWQVVMLGAAFDNWRQGVSYGNEPSHTHTIARSKLGATGMTLAGSRAAYGATGQSMGFSDEVKADLAKDD